MNINKLKKIHNLKSQLQDELFEILKFILTPIIILNTKYDNYKRNKKETKVNHLTDEQVMKLLGDSIIKRYIKCPRDNYVEIVVCGYDTDEGWYGGNICRTIERISCDDILNDWAYKLPYDNVDRCEFLTDILKDYLNTIDGVKAEYFLDEKRGNGCWFKDYKKTLSINMK